MMPFGQVLTAMITPFTETGQVDYEKVWRTGPLTSPIMAPTVSS